MTRRVISIAELAQSATGASSSHWLAQASATLGVVLLAALSGWVPSARIAGVSVIVVCAAALVIINIVAAVLNRRAHIMANRNYLSLKIGTEPAPEEGIEGLILLISPFQSFNSALAGRREEVRERVRRVLDSPDGDLTLDDFEGNDKLDIKSSNLNVAIEAISYHARDGLGDLSCVWLVTTSDEPVYEDGEVVETRTGSYDVGRLLAKYLYVRFGPAIRVHLDECVVRAADYKQIWDTIDSVFDKSRLKERAILVDITGGTKMMTMAAAMACIDRYRRMQYMDTGRDAQGQPLKDKSPRPLLVDVDAILDARSSVSEA